MPEAVVAEAHVAGLAGEQDFDALGGGVLANLLHPDLVEGVAVRRLENGEALIGSFENAFLQAWNEMGGDVGVEGVDGLDVGRFVAVARFGFGNGAQVRDFGEGLEALPVFLKVPSGYAGHGGGIQAAAHHGSDGGSGAKRVADAGFEDFASLFQVRVV